MVNAVASTNQEAAHVAAEVQDFAALPNRTVQQLVEIAELCFPSGHNRRHSDYRLPRQTNEPYAPNAQRLAIVIKNMCLYLCSNLHCPRHWRWVNPVTFGPTLQCPRAGVDIPVSSQ